MPHYDPIMYVFSLGMRGNEYLFLSACTTHTEFIPLKAVPLGIALGSCLFNRFLHSVYSLYREVVYMLRAAQFQAYFESVRYVRHQRKPKG